MHFISFLYLFEMDLLWTFLNIYFSNFTYRKSMYKQFFSDNISSSGWKFFLKVQTRGFLSVLMRINISLHILVLENFALPSLKIHFQRDALTKIARIPKNPAGKRMKKRTHVNKLCSSKIPVFLSRLARLRFRFVRPFPSSVEPIFVKQTRWTVQHSSQLTPRDSRCYRYRYYYRRRHCCRHQIVDEPSACISLKKRNEETRIEKMEMKKYVYLISLWLLIISVNEAKITRHLRLK